MHTIFNHWCAQQLSDMHTYFQYSTATVQCIFWLSGCRANQSQHKSQTLQSAVSVEAWLVCSLQCHLFSVCLSTCLCVKHLMQEITVHCAAFLITHMTASVLTTPVSAASVVTFWQPIQSPSTYQWMLMKYYPDQLCLLWLKRALGKNLSVSIEVWCAWVRHTFGYGLFLTSVVVMQTASAV